MSVKTGRYQWNKDPRLKEATVSEEGEDIWHDLQGDPRAGDCKENNLQGMHPVVLSYATSSFCFHLDTTTVRLSFTFHCV
jgi:hypothetical protein